MQCILNQGNKNVTKLPQFGKLISRIDVTRVTLLRSKLVTLPLRSCPRDFAVGPSRYVDCGDPGCVWVILMEVST